MPIIKVELLEGRTLEQKREMVKGITEVVAKTTNCAEENVKIVIRDMKLDEFSEGGILRCDR